MEREELKVANHKLDIGLSFQNAKYLFGGQRAF